MKILLIEDNQVLAKSLIRGLKNEGFSVEHFVRGDDGLKFLYFNHTSLDLLLLDLMLPGKSGEEICREARANKIEIPILMLTAKGEVSQKVAGLNLGADDYLAKPFDFSELVARIRALLRRKPHLEDEKIKLTADIIFDSQAKKVTRKSREISLSPKEFAILEVLVRNRGRALTRDQIFERVSDFASDNWSNSIDVHIKNIRKKLFTNEDPIKTVRGVGYRLEKFE